MIKHILFDLDGTLLDMDQPFFTKEYFKAITKFSVEFGYNPQEFMEGLIAGDAAMQNNDGGLTNEQVFWQTFAKKTGRNITETKCFNQFYEEVFDSLSFTCKPFNGIKEDIEKLKKQGYNFVIASNPRFPLLAMVKRLHWAGLSEDMFEYITSYETCNFSKPNPKYYSEVCDRLNYKPNECIMIGNDLVEDMSAEKMGMYVFYLDRNGKNANIEYPNGNFNDLLSYIEKLNN